MKKNLFRQTPDPPIFYNGKGEHGKGKRVKWSLACLRSRDHKGAGKKRGVEEA